MRQSHRRRVARALGAVAILALGLEAGVARASPADGAQAAPALAAEKPYLDENAVAMDRMMAGMEVRPTGDVSRDFVAMMIPHHQGAIDMAQAYLRYGHNEQLRRVAQEIIVEQQQEIAAMDLAIGVPLPASAPAPTGIASPAEPAGADRHRPPSPHQHALRHDHDPHPSHPGTSRRDGAWRPRAGLRRAGARCRG